MEALSILNGLIFGLLVLILIRLQRENRSLEADIRELRLRLEQKESDE